MHFVRMLIYGAVASLASTISSADTLPVPNGAPILTVKGAVSVTNVGDAAVFDLEMLRQMGGDEITTSTIWTEGVNTFTGVRLSVLLQHLEVDNGTIDAIAINDYAVQIPVGDAREGPALIAYEINGAEMSIRNKGPLWIVYPFDSDPKFQSETYHSRSIWQLDRIMVVE